MLKRTAAVIPLVAGVPFAFAAEPTSSRQLGIGKNSRVRATPCARRRALGSASSTTKSTMTGEAMANCVEKYWLSFGR